MVDLKKVIRPNILALQPYRCARDDFKTGILLDANENTHGPSLTNISEEEKELELNRYPDPHQIELKQQLVDFRNAKPNRYLKGEGLKPENLCLGVGSDESIDSLLRCVCAPGKEKLLICPPTYGMYGICAQVNDVEIVKVPLLAPSFEVDVEAVTQKITSDTTVKMVYLTSPGNPTGKLLDVADVIKLLEVEWNGLVVVDEAYIDFTEEDSEKKSQSVSTLVNQYPNLVVLQTLSKSFGLAGIRLGVAFSTPELSYYLNSMKYPYNISSLTAQVALRATDPKDGINVMTAHVSSINKQRSWLLEALQKLKFVGKNLGGLDSNFLLLEILDKEGNPSNDIAKKLYNTLAVSNDVVVRFRGNELNCEGALRISVGTEEENKVLVQKFEACLNEINK